MAAKSPPNTSKHSFANSNNISALSATLQNYLPKLFSGDCIFTIYSLKSTKSISDGMTRTMHMLSFSLVKHYLLAFAVEILMVIKENVYLETFTPPCVHL